MRKDLTILKGKLHNNVVEKYGYNPFVDNKEGENIIIRQALSYILNSHIEKDGKKKFTLNEIAFLVTGYDRKEKYNHATVLHSIGVIRDQRHRYEGIENILSDCYIIVGHTLNNSSVYLSRFRKFFNKLENTYKFSDEDTTTLTLIKDLSFSNIDQI